MAASFGPIPLFPAAFSQTPLRLPPPADPPFKYPSHPPIASSSRRVNTIFVFTLLPPADPQPILHTRVNQQTNCIRGNPTHKRHHLLLQVGHEQCANVLTSGPTTFACPIRRRQIFQLEPPTYLTHYARRALPHPQAANQLSHNRGLNKASSRPTQLCPPLRVNLLAVPIVETCTAHEPLRFAVFSDSPSTHQQEKPSVIAHNLHQRFAQPRADITTGPISIKWAPLCVPPTCISHRAPTSTSIHTASLALPTSAPTTPTIFFPRQHTKLQPDASPLEIPVSTRCTLRFLFRSRARLSSVSICLSDQVPSKPAENESQASLQVSAPLLPVGLIHHPTRSHYYANPQSASMKSSPIPTT